MSAPVLELEGLTVGYDGAPVVRGLDLEVGQGEIVALLGANGAGKTTTLRAVSGLAHPLAGVVRFGGADLRKVSPSGRARLGIASASIPIARRSSAASVAAASPAGRPTSSAARASQEGRSAATMRFSRTVRSVDEGRLAGSVRPDQPDQLTLLDDDVDLVDGAHAAETHGQAGRREDGRHEPLAGVEAGTSAFCFARACAVR